MRMSTSIRHAARGLAQLWALPVAALLAVNALGCAATTDEDDISQEEVEDTDRYDDALTNNQKRAVSDHIKTVAKKQGVTNALLFAGVPNHESGLVQCWKDATWACKGPHSNYCGGPVIAGSGDGPCANKQGGLGMYQLDAGTHAQTLASYGNDVVELDGQIDGGVDIIISKVWHCPNTPHFDNKAEVVSWINAAKPGTAKYEVFLTAMAYCYNGCKPGWSCHEPMRANYRAGVKKLADAFGNEYWYGGASTPAAPPVASPPDGCGIMTPGESLAAGKTASSCNGTYDLKMQADGNLVLYHQGVGAIWSTKTNGKGGSSAIMQTDGNFVLYTSANKALWSSVSYNHKGSYLAIQDDGNLVVYSPGGTPLWDSDTNGK
ncbi:MAG: hypothetical protein ABI134_35345 [Byssovorax sp.]